jgi:hypothetical protein
MAGFALTPEADIEIDRRRVSNLFYLRSVVPSEFRECQRRG